MRATRHLLCGFLVAFGIEMALFATSAPASAPADSTLPQRKMVEAAREKRAYRTALWASRLEGDMRTIYGTYGHPSTRYREAVMGRMLEKWTYIDIGKQFTFEGSRLVRTMDFIPGSVPGSMGRF